VLPVEPALVDDGAEMVVFDELTVVLIAVEVPLHPLPFVTVTLNEPETLATNACPVAPLIGPPLNRH